MVSRFETIPSRRSMTSLEPTKEEILERLTALEEESEKLREENKRLKAKLRWYEGPHTPPSKDQSTEEESSSSGGDEDDEQPRTDGGSPGRNPDMSQSGGPHLTQIRKSRSLATVVQSVATNLTSRRASAPDSSRRHPIHSHQR